MATVIDELIVRLGIKTDRHSFRNAESRMGRLNASIRRSSGTIRRNMVRTGVAVSGMVSGLAVAAYRSAATYEKELLKLQTLVGQTPEQIEKYRTSIKKLSEDTTIAQNELANSLFKILSANNDLKHDDAMEILTRNAMAAATHLGELHDLTQFEIVALKQMGVEGAKALDMFHMTGKLGQFEPSRLIPGLPELMTFASQLKIEMSEILGSLATLTKGGFSEAQSLQMLKGTLSKLQSPNPEGLGMLADKLGIDTTKDETHRRDAANAQLRKKIAEVGLVGTVQWLEQLTGGSVTALSRFFAEEDSKMFFAQATANADEFQSIREQIAAASGNMPASFKIAEDTPEFTIQQVLNNVRVLLNELWGEMRTWIEHLGGLESVFHQIRGAGQMLKGAFEAMLPVLGAVADAVKKLTGIENDLMAWAITLGIAFLGLTNILTLVRAGVAALTVVLGLTGLLGSVRRLKGASTAAAAVVGAETVADAVTGDGDKDKEKKGKKGWFQIVKNWIGKNLNWIVTTLAGGYAIIHKWKQNIKAKLPNIGKNNLGMFQDFVDEMDKQPLSKQRKDIRAWKEYQKYARENNISKELSDDILKAKQRRYWRIATIQALSRTTAYGMLPSLGGSTPLNIDEAFPDGRKHPLANVRPLSEILGMRTKQPSRNPLFLGNQPLSSVDNWLGKIAPPPLQPFGGSERDPNKPIDPILGRGFWRKLFGLEPGTPGTGPDEYGGIPGGDQAGPQSPPPHSFFLHSKPPPPMSLPFGADWMSKLVPPPPPKKLEGPPNPLMSPMIEPFLKWWREMKERGAPMLPDILDDPQAMMQPALGGMRFAKVDHHWSVNISVPNGDAKEIARNLQGEIQKTLGNQWRNVQEDFGSAVVG